MLPEELFRGKSRQACQIRYFARASNDWQTEWTLRYGKQRDYPSRKGCDIIARRSKSISDSILRRQTKEKTAPSIIIITAAATPPPPPPPPVYLAG